MKTIIAGSRSCTDPVELRKALSACGWVPSVVISGCAAGVDRLGEEWSYAMRIPCLRFPANWDLWGKAAGFRRNEEMAEHAEALLALWDGASHGTEHMIQTAREKGLWVYVHRIPLIGTTQ